MNARDSLNKYQGPAKPVPTYRDPFPDSWLYVAFAVMAAVFVFIVFVMEW